MGIALSKVSNTSKLRGCSWLTQDSRYFGQFMQRPNLRSQSLTRFLYRYAKLTGRFLLMDVKTLSYDTDDVPEIATPRFLPTFAHLQVIDAEGNHIGKSVETHYKWRWQDDTSEFLHFFMAGGASLPVLSKYAEELLKIIPRSPRLFEYLTDVSRVMDRFVNAIAVAAGPPQGGGDANSKMIRAYDYFKIMSAGLNAIIEKNVTYLTPDAANVQVSSLAHILLSAIRCNPRVARDVVDKQRKICPDVSDSHLYKIISIEWKFSVLKKLMTSAQMQLRVVGVTTMCQDLLFLHGQHRKEIAPHANPVLLHVANLILQQKLIDYIVGIGSHPEIINESSNILGFLVVTKTYENEQTDIIWNTVRTSQDPRVVEAILKMVKKVLNLYDYQSCLYLCEKIDALSIQAFTVSMRDFCEHLFREIAPKSGDEELDTPPYDICIRLIRESSIVNDESPNGHPEIQSFAATHLRELLAHGPSLNARRDLYTDCIKDISAKSSTASGSICVIHALLRQSLRPDLEVLTLEHGLTRLMVDELELSIDENRSLAYDSPANLARREILLQIILTAPDTIHAGLGTRLWNLLVGSQSTNTPDRVAGWQILNTAFQAQRFDNRYLAICFQSYLTKLEPTNFLEGTLTFVKSGISFWLSGVTEDEKADLSFNSFAMEQLWRIIESAPQGKVYEKAIQEIVGVYMSPFVENLPRVKARELHQAFITRCLDKLADAAGKLKGSVNADDEDMVMEISESEIEEQKLLFTRSLAALQAFLTAYSGNVHFATPKLRSAVTSSNAVQGTTLKIMYQAFDDNTSPIKELTIDALDTAATLVAKLQQETEFASCRLFYCGKEFIHDDTELCKSVEDLNLNGLVLVKRRDNADPPLPTSNGPLQLEITKKFDQLWSYLGMQESLAEKIYTFLVQFPVYERILEDLNNLSTPYTEIFPLGRPYKALYGLHGLTQYISSQSLQGSVDEAVSGRAMALLISVISDSKFLKGDTPQTIRQTLAVHFISSLASLLKDPVLPQSSTVSIDDMLLRRLLDLLNAAKLVTTTDTSVNLIWSSVDALLEVATQNSALWSSFVDHLENSTLLPDLLLEDPRPFVRKALSKHITNKFTFNPNPSRVSTSDVAVTLWPIVKKLVSKAVTRREQCEEFFQLAWAIFNRLLETSVDPKLEILVREWGKLLLNHQNHEDIGLPDTVDPVTQGLTVLLHHAVTTMIQSEEKYTCGDLGVALFEKYLFPALSSDDDIGSNGLIAQKIPLINSRVRNFMGETVFALVKDDTNEYKKVLTLMSELVYYDTRTPNPYYLDMPTIFERSKYVRSPTGYVGLKNLSNTCYLNSLLTQLFMNVSFREFILDIRITVPARQRLLIETKSLFSYMQTSMRRCVDPTNFAAAIQTFDNQEIDVSVQMDVDEFYNLLFDRLEGNCVTEADKRKVRSFYGGKLVQQIKSKECPHISGRSEDFCAIQCDIMGKKSLQESLQAYVEGEAMEGDNKYKCETCNRHVDAVKRACFKDVPDNLIFHLKRFDFNLRTLTRSKINDHFTFPSSIDMRPYKVEYLMNDSGEIEEDAFKLVGVLVHSGTAETGHYYSFTRERPQAADQGGWIEFNDDSVNSWDSAFMEVASYGGLESATVENPIQFEKNYSAYMLFYQRSSTLNTADKGLVKTSATSSEPVIDQPQAIHTTMENKSMIRNPLKVGIDPVQTNHIIRENELVMRKYCLADPAHVIFARNIFENARHLNKHLHDGKCSDAHEFEKQVMWIAMCHLDQVVARVKDAPDIVPFVNALRAQCQACGECSRDFLDYLCKCPDSFRFLLLKCPEAMVRSEVGLAVLGALVSVKNGIQYAYGLGVDGNIVPDDPHLLQDVVSALIRLYENFHNSLRAWPEYFGLLTSIANLGDHEAAVLLDSGFLLKALEIICADTADNNDPQIQRMLNIIAKRNTPARPVSYEAIIDLLSRLISACDPQAPEIDQCQSRLQLSHGANMIPYTWEEKRKLNLYWSRTNTHVLTEKLLSIDQNQPSTKQILASLLHFPDGSTHLDRYMFLAIMHGMRRNSQLPWGPFLRAAVLYCEHSENPSGIQDVVRHVSKAAVHLENNDATEYLGFFKDLINLPTNSSEVSRADIMKYMLLQTSEWVPPIITHYNGDVRTDTEDFLGEIMFNLSTEVDNSAPEAEIDLASHRLEMIQRLGLTCLEYLEDTYIVQRVQAIRGVLVNIETITNQCIPYFEPGEVRDTYKQKHDSKFISLSTVRKVLTKFRSLENFKNICCRGSR